MAGWKLLNQKPFSAMYVTGICLCDWCPIRIKHINNKMNNIKTYNVCMYMFLWREVLALMDDSLLVPYEPSWPRRSSATGLLSVPVVRAKHGEAGAVPLLKQTSIKLQVCWDSQWLFFLLMSLIKPDSRKRRFYSSFFINLHCNFYSWSVFFYFSLNVKHFE